MHVSEEFALDSTIVSPLVRVVANGARINSAHGANEAVKKNVDKFVARYEIV